MLFLLTSEIQTGKTRWLEGLIQELQTQQIPFAGVIAPGIWRKVDSESIEVPKTKAEEMGFLPCSPQSYEKRGIDNVLLPSNERISFARRADLADHNTYPAPTSQSNKARLGWSISDSAIERVNNHLSNIEIQAFDNEATSASSPIKTSNRSSKEADSQHDSALLGRKAAEPGLLIIDEIGRLELQHGTGLTAAVSLLKRGPSSLYPHALIVVRSSLALAAELEFGPAWGETARIAPTPEDKAHLLRQLIS